LIAELDVAVVGAGVVGLAIAGEVAQQRRGVFAFEKNGTFGLETSSRNSEVIHGGLYYPENSLKARFCVEGNPLLYQLCADYEIPHSRLGKIILAVTEEEIPKLESIAEQGNRNGVRDLTPVSRTDLKKLEPNVEGVAGLLSPSTGILDSYSLLKLLHGRARERGAEFVFGTEVMGLETSGSGYKVEIRDREGVSSFLAKVVVNAAGLGSDKIAEMVGIDTAGAGYKLHYCKGEYFSVDPRWRHQVSRLVYPTPEQAGLGVHLTLGLDGRSRLGPNAYYVDEIDYLVTDTHKDAFYQSAKRYLPFIEPEDLAPEFAGVRPKLQAPGELFRDFVIAHEDKAGFPGLINLIGIESPGLTAAPAIAQYVGRMVAEILN
jgi:L-2-hydroxyglutarate oxidase LhgO